MTEISRCSICERRRADESEFCELHEAARRNIDQACQKWLDAYEEGLSRSEFLQRIMENDATGEAAVEVASHLLGKLNGAPAP